MMTIRFAIIEFFFWVMFGDISGFASVYLLDCGFTNMQIGIIIAVAASISVILQPIIASYADLPRSLSLKTIILIQDGFLILLSLFLIITNHTSLPLTGILYCMMVMLIQLMNPFVIALGTECINQGKNLNFGIARGMGSVGYAVLSYSLGIILGITGARMQPVSVLATTVALGISVFCFPFTKEYKNTSETATQNTNSNPIAFFAQYKRFGVTLLGCMLVYISHVLINNFAFQIVTNKGGGSSEMGVAMAIAALAELPVLFLFSYMMKKVRCDIWFRISGIVFTLKSLFTLLTPNIPSFYLIQLLQMLGFALITAASVYYVNSIVERQDAIKGQAYMTMSYTLASIFGSVLGGILIDLTGVNGMVLFATISAFAGMVIMLFATERCTCDESVCN